MIRRLRAAWRVLRDPERLVDDILRGNPAVWR